MALRNRMMEGCGRVVLQRVPLPRPVPGVAPFVLHHPAVHVRLGSFARLLGSASFRNLAERSPWLFAGADLHRAGLEALATAEYDWAERLFEQAASRYRDELRTEPLARVRVHQLMARACAAGGRISPLSLEVDRALARLDAIESPSHPFALVPAHALLANWLEDTAEAGERLAA